MFKKYQHVERFGNIEVEGIEIGNCHIFPKLDGTNASVWFEDGEIKTGSRNRQLTLDEDNQGFCNFAIDDTPLYNYFKIYPNHRLFGEWLKPHSLKTYRDNSWSVFYIFDVCIDVGENGIDYIPYEIYKPKLDEFKLDYIPLLATIKNGSYKQFVNCLNNNVFLIKDGEGTGEGVVIKNYEYINKFGRVTWAKIVKSEFKELHSKTMGAPAIKGKKMVEEEITNKYCTDTLIEKEFEKIKNEHEGWSSKCIHQLFNTIYYCVVKEESWNYVKEFKNPTVNYKTLNHFIVQKIKEVKKELF